ncbi:50S ribosomal protein L15 [Alphaproteobacteria bacterium]|nr:50S ribosomal protein L15 [Alphaproteobacteria bacterium]
MELHTLTDNKGATRNRKRVGRGVGSGIGKTSGSGHKGQKARSGVAIKGFEGGQMPIHRRLPKRGFVNIFRKTFVEVNIGNIQKEIDAGRIDTSKPIDVAVLQSAGLVGKPKDGVRLLGKGIISAKVEIHVTGASNSSVSSVEKAGGTVVMPIKGTSE